MTLFWLCDIKIYIALPELLGISLCGTGLCTSGRVIFLPVVLFYRSTPVGEKCRHPFSFRYHPKNIIKVLKTFWKFDFSAPVWYTMSGSKCVALFHMLSLLWKDAPMFWGCLSFSTHFLLIDILISHSFGYSYIMSIVSIAVINLLLFTIL